MTLSYLGEPFEHDIFLSYGHGAWEGGDSAWRKWSDGFAKELERELRFNRDLRSGLNMFRDTDPRKGHGHDRMAELHDAFENNVRASAILLVLMSDDYLESEWCSKERLWWFDARKAHALPATPNLVIAKLIDTAEAWPDEFTDKEGEPPIAFDFCDRSRQELRPLAWPMPNEGSHGAFRDGILDLVGYLRNCLGDTKEALDAKRLRAEQRKKLAAEGGQVIYLHGRSEHAPTWEKHRQELEDDGFGVFPPEPDPVVGNTEQLQRIRNLRIETMSACDAVLLLGTEDRRALAADLVVVGRKDRHDAIARSDGILPCAVLDAADDSAKDDRTRTSAEKLGIDWLDASQNNWIPQMQHWLLDAAQ